MRKHRKHLVALVGAAIAIGSVAVTPITASAAEGNSSIKEGKAIAFSRKKGNCLACHLMDDGVSAGTIAPPLMAMKSRYPDREKLKAQIYDATSTNPESSMPPFGKHGIISAEELEKVVDYIWSL
jgi:L-cysteine S-thiosulfotransferase